MSFQLRPYQQSIVDEVFIKNDNVLVVLPTGGGKTVIAKELIRRIKTPVLFIVPKLELIRQAYNTFDEECDIIWSDKTQIFGNHITVASKQTLMRRNLKDYFNVPITIIVDEVHIGLQSLKKTIKDVQVDRIIGLTATPERNDGKSFIVKEKAKQKFSDNKIYEYAVFDRIINKWTINKLQKLGFLSPINLILNPQAEELSAVKTKHSYDEELDSDVIMSTMGDNFFAFIKKAENFAGKPTIIFTPELKMLEVVQETLNKSNLNYASVDGSMPVEQRKLIYDDLEKGRIDGIVNCGVLTTGFDMPCVKQCIILRHIKSRVLFYQIIGRFIRPYQNQTAQVYDFGGSAYNFITAANPDIIKNPAPWRYEGFEVKETEKERKAREESEHTKDVLDEMNITWTEYIKNPIPTLLECLLHYKESFEQNLNDSVALASSRIEDKFKQNLDIEKQKIGEKINKIVQNKENKLKDEILKNNEDIINQRVNQLVKKQISIQSNPLKSWFQSNGFEWFRQYYPRILQHYQWCYNNEYILMKSEWKECEGNPLEEEKFHNRYKKIIDILNEIENVVIKKLPFDNLSDQLASDKNMYSIFSYLYKERVDWWLSHFKLKFEEPVGKPDTHVISDIAETFKKEG